jgi:hypothetical protein
MTPDQTSEDKPYSRERLNPLEVIKRLWPKATVDHITFDPNVKKQYSVIRASSHDGTLVFTIELLEKTLIDILVGGSFYRPDEPDWSRNPTPKYTVGWIRHSTVFGRVNLPAGNMRGQRERMRMKVRVEWSYP